VIFPSNFPHTKPVYADALDTARNLKSKVKAQRGFGKN
jgi:hypothetical protein